MSPSSSALRAAPLANRLTAVIRLHTANPWTTLITPWLISLGIFGATVSIWFAIIAAAGGRDQLDPDAFANNGGQSWIFIFMMVTAIQTMSQTFPFALGMGTTRRDYYLGTGLYLVGLSLFYGLGMALLGIAERATEGWGIGGTFFSPSPLNSTPGWQLFPFFALALMWFFAVGTVAGAAWVRWKVVGVYAFIGSIVVLVVGMVWVITAVDGWHRVGDYVTGHTALTHAISSLPLTALGATVGYLLMRRAAPRA